MTFSAEGNPGAEFQPQDVKICQESDRDKAIATMELAFSGDPAVRWLYPEAHQFITNFPSFAQAFAGKAFRNGTAYYIGEFAGSALWLPPGVYPDEEAFSEVITRSASGQKLDEAMAILEQMGSYHPSEPHWYLPMIGVEPAQQGKGYGTALLQHTLAICDRNREIAYLESSNTRNMPLYQKMGFRVVGEIQAGSFPTIYPMVRDPQ